MLLVGVALGGDLPAVARFDRKNYFYPDIPKGYQISQYQDPLVSGGILAEIAITRVHLEEDTARSQHEEEHSLVDFNRAGVPLMELVTEPVIHDAAGAGMFARELQMLLRYLGVSEANMEQGQMRVEANISVSAREGELGTKVEVKNLNSFRSVERAIAYEIERQSGLIGRGGAVAQETRGWDERRQQTFPQRSKENAHDYRYFPEPDLPQLALSSIPEFSSEQLAACLPELPAARRRRYRYIGLNDTAADLFTANQPLGDFFDGVAQRLSAGDHASAANYVASNLAGLLEKGAVSAAWLREDDNRTRFAELISLVSQGTLSSRGAKDTLGYMTTESGGAEVIARAHGLMQESSAGALEVVAKKVMDLHPAVVADYRAGKGAALQFLLGQGMRESGGAANPVELKKVLEGLLG